MNERDYRNFCNRYDLDPEDYDDVLYTLDELEGIAGDESGKLQAIREYIYNNKLNMTSNEDKQDIIAVKVYQIENTRNCRYSFMSYDFAKKVGINLDDYVLVGVVNIISGGQSDVSAILDEVFAYGNSNSEFYADNPRARSISISDILEVNGDKYYVDSIGFQKLQDDILTEDKEELASDNEEDDDEEPKSALDYLDDLQNRQISVAELNIILQSIFGRFNDIFILESDLYNADMDETQVLKIMDDADDLYKIYYDIIDVQNGIIEITKSTME